MIKLAIYQKNEIWQLWMDYLRVKSFSFVTNWSKVLKHCFSLLNFYLADTWFIFGCTYPRNFSKCGFSFFFVFVWNLWKRDVNLPHQLTIIGITFVLPSSFSTDQHIPTSHVGRTSFMLRANSNCVCYTFESDLCNE